MALNLFNTSGIMDRGQQAWEDTDANITGMMDKYTRNRAGRAYAAGDQAGAAAALAQGGNLDGARTINRDIQSQDQEAYNRGRDAKDDEAEAVKQRFGLMKQLSGALRRVPWEDGTAPAGAKRLAFIQKALPTLGQMGIPVEAFSTLTADQLNNENLDLFDGGVDDQYKQFFQMDGNVVGVKANGQTDVTYRGRPKPIEMDPTKDYYVPDSGDAPVSTASPETDALFDSLIKQESGGRPGVVGPQTAYGRAEGMTQMLPETAQEMAGKAGLPWRPELMRGTTPEAAEYQKRLGKAYLDEGLAKYGGDARKALMYYHGGPNERLWGPKTQAYADQVLARAGGSDRAEGGAGGDEMGMPGYRRIQRGTPKQEDQWVDLPGGGQRNLKNGKVEGVSARDASKTFTQEQQLRSQFGHLPAVKDLATVRPHIATIGSIAEKANKAPGSVTAQDDIALIFAFMKMLDPGSVVREGEFANAEATGGIPDRIVNLYNKALKGTRLNDKQRNEFFSTASIVMRNYTNGYADQADRYRSMATSYGLEPDRVAERGNRRPPSATRPPPGAAKRPALNDIFK